MKKSLCLLFLLVLSSGCAVEQSNGLLRNAAFREAVVRGEVRDFLNATEAKAIEAERKQNWWWASNFYHDASMAARETSQLQKAIDYGEKAFETADKARDPRQQVQAILQLVVTLAAVGQRAETMEWLQKGSALLNQVRGDKEIAEGRLYRSLGSEFLERGDVQRAIDSLAHSLRVLESRLAYFKKISSSVDREVILNTAYHTVFTLVRLGAAYRRAGQVDQAIMAYERSIALIKETGLSTQGEADLYYGLGDTYLAKNDFQRAMENLQKALALAESQQRLLVVSSASVRIGDVLRQTGKPAEAMPHYQKSIQQTESTRSLLQSQEYRQSFFEGGLDAYVSIVRALLESGKPEEAFNYSERARSRAFLDLVGSKVQLSRLKSGLLEEEKALKERIAAIKARLSGEADGETNRAGLGKELAAAEQAYNSFLTKVRGQDKEQASLMSVEPLALKQVQELIDPAQTLIEYFVTDTEMFVWVVEKDKLNFQRVALSKNNLAKQVKTLRELIATLGEPRELNEVSSSLYKSLIQPLLPYITGKELIIVPHDVLHYLPFQALVGSDGRYLIEKYPINYLSSASLLQFTKEKSRAMGEKVLALGNPDLGDPKMNLKFAEIEAKEIKNVYPQSTIYLAKEATEEKAKSLSPQNDIIHFASHAELNEDDPLASAIRLAKSDKEDGRLEVREIFGMDLKASLVVLSACETGLGKLSSGDELVGLTRAFIYAGTPSVVASLWNVEDSSTAQLMASFYKNLKTMTKVEALRQAQLNLIRGNVNSDLLARRGIGGVGKLGEVPAGRSLSPDSISISTSHPYFWAPFILVGEGK